MRQDIATDLTLTALHKRHIGLHTLLGEAFGEKVADISIRVQTTQGDELPDKAELTKVPDVLLHLLLRKLGSIPVERGRQVVCKPLFRIHSMYTISELFSLGQNRRLGFHPEQVRIRSKGHSTMHSTLGTTAVLIITLTCTRSIPIPKETAVSVNAVLSGKVPSTTV